jgi:predicted transcriptional regulator
MHPRVDILKLLSESDYDPYRLGRELGIPYRDLYSHLKVIEKANLIDGRFQYHLTEKGRQILSRLESEGGIG